MSDYYEKAGDIQIIVSGMDELIEDIRSFSKKYPDDAGDFLQKNGKEFRKEYIRNIKQKIKHASGSDKSLAKMKNIKISPVYGYGSGQRVDVGSISPHYHLFERGHNLIIPWSGVTGFVEGRFVMKDSIDDFEKKYPQLAEQWIDKMLQKGKFI